MTSRLTLICSTSLLMYPSLFMSYRLKAHLSFSITDPRSRTERPITKSCQMLNILSSQGIVFAVLIYLSKPLFKWLSLNYNDLYLKAYRPTSVYVECIEKEMCICGCIWKRFILNCKY